MRVTASRVAYEALPSRVIFGAGCRAEVPAEVERLGARRALLIDGLLDGAVARRLAEDLGAAHAHTFDAVRQHVPAELAAEARRTAADVDADGIVAMGGGSAIGLAKAVALELRLPIVAVPTTYAGSEMTPIWGLTTDARKTTGSDSAVLPRAVIYDAELTLTFPPEASAASGMNAIAHCVEALWTQAANPVTDAVALEGIALLAAGLRGVVADPDALAARSEALRGAWLGGTALAVAGTALHHKICHVLGGTFDLPHAEVHAIVLPWVVDHFSQVAPDALRRVARALDADDAVSGLQQLSADLGLSAGLADLGLADVDLDLAAELVERIAPTEPAPVTAEEVRALLARAMATSNPRAVR